MRPLTNLRPRTEFRLDVKQLRSGFIGIFDAKLGSKNALADIYYMLVADAFLPAVRDLHPNTDEVKKVMAPKDGMSSLRDRDRHRVVRSTLRKNNAAKRLEFRTPLAQLNAGAIATRLGISYIFGVKPNEAGYVEGFDNTEMVGGHIISGKDVDSLFKNIPSKARALFKDCLLSLEATKEGNDVWLWGTFIITQPEAEYLCNCKWVELRLSDIYPTLIDWTASVFGRYSRLPKTITKVSMIANEVKDVLATSEPGKVKPRTGVSGIVADINGDYYVIPEVDQSAEYEQLLMEFGLQEDGSYSWNQIKKLGKEQPAEGLPPEEDEEGEGDEGENYRVGEENINDLNPGQRKKLPANMPIFSDWLNDKFVYSNTAGNLAVYDLSDTVPATAYHFTQFFDTKIKGGEGREGGMAAFLNQMVNVAGGFDSSIWNESVVASDAKVRSSRDLMNAVDRVVPHSDMRARSFADAMSRAFLIQKVYAGEGGADAVYQGRDNIRYEYVKIEDLVPNSQFDAFKFVGRIVTKAAEAIENNMEVLYNRMSVMSALKLLAVARMMKESAPAAKQIRELDTKERNAYINQGVDPTYKPAPIANIKELKINKKTGEVESGLVFQPHQAKIDNLMREHPKCAAYPVDAGGGKTILLMTNILREMQAGVCKRPIIACPSTLVNQYVEEAVFVTEGRVNIIPVTNQTVRMHGLETIAKMIEQAPPNTIVVTDFDFVKGKSKILSYGNRSIIMWNNAEWLRQFEFDLMCVDECHKLKNISSARRQAVARLMQDIPYKRIASGTLVDDTLTDLVSQIALMDPTIFGSQEKFKADYGDDVRGNKVLSWKKGSQEAIQQKIRDNMIWAQARRKEWASLLPPAKEEFWAVDLSENQRLLYDSILQETTDLIEEAMSKDPELKEALESGDETLADDLEAMLRPYLSRLERFLSAPEVDELAPVFLKTEDDKISPKVRKIHEICQEHLRKKLPGKIVIFTNYKASAEAVFKFAPPDLRKTMIHYTAGRKMECRAEFARNPNKMIMVGQSSSMDTGINFQVASRLIRMETIWTPGLLEQGNARINRPQLKKAEMRNMVYFDWIMVNRSIDITKVARLTAKIISKAKFDNAGPGGFPDYAELPDMPIIPMNIETIAAKNDFLTDLKDYLDAYSELNAPETGVRARDYAEYRRENEGKLHPVPVPHGKLLPGSKLMSRVPYVPGMALYGTDQLGLVRYDEFCNIDLDEFETSDDESEEGEDALGKDEAISDQDPKAVEKRRHLAALERRWEAERALVMNMPCHTEYGDGVIIGLKKKVWIRFPWSGKMWRIPKLQVFVITRTTTNNKDMRKELLKAVGDIPIDAPIEVPVEVGRQTNKIRKQIAEKKAVKEGKRPVKEETPDEETGASFQFAIINDMLAIEFDAEASSPEAAAAMQNYGFKLSPDFWIARIKGPIVMVNLFNNLAAKGFTVDKKTGEHLKRIYLVIKKQKSLIKQAGFATSLDITHFLRETVKPSADPKQMKVYPMVRDGLLYMVMPIKGQSANAKAVKVPSPMIQWKKGGGQSEMLRFCKNKAEALQVLQRIKADGIKILNAKELEKQWKTIKVGGKIKLPKTEKE
jgi:hypothetical protein